MHGLDPKAYLHLLLERIADHPVNRVSELLPWAINSNALQAAAWSVSIPRLTPDAYV